MIYPYKKIKLSRREPDFFGERFILKPIIQFEVASRGIVFRTQALLDTGADFCIFHGSVARLLKLPMNDGISRPFGGIVGKSGIAYLHEVTMTIANHPYQTVCGFSDDINPFGYAILGQKGFFDHFQVLFDNKTGVISVDPPP